MRVVKPYLSGCEVPTKLIGRVGASHQDDLAPASLNPCSIVIWERIGAGKEVTELDP